MHRIGRDPHGRAGAAIFDVDADLAQPVVRQVERIGDGRADIGRHGDLGFLAGKGLEVAREGGETLDHLVHGAQYGAELAAPTTLLEQACAGQMRRQRGHRLAHFMGHTRQRLAKARELGRLYQALLGVAFRLLRTNAFGNLGAQLLVHGMQVFGALGDPLFEPVVVGQSMGHQPPSLLEQHDDEDERGAGECRSARHGQGTGIDGGERGETQDAPAMLGQSQLLQHEIARRLRVRPGQQREFAAA